MTQIAHRKTRLRVEFGDNVRERGKYRAVLMEFHPFAITVRLKGLRRAYTISPGAIDHNAVMAEVERQRAERRAARKGRK